MMAKMGGSTSHPPRLCTFGYLGRAVLEKYADDEPERFKSIQVRFSKPVFPGETIVSELWQVSPTEIVCKARVRSGTWTSSPTRR